MHQPFGHVAFRMRSIALAAVLALAPAAAASAREAAAEASAGLAELRHVVGAWDVRTTYFNPDGSVARAVDGSYEFEWAVPDAIVSGISRQPMLDSVSAILFYLRPSARQIEMVSVDQNGVRWVMTGSDGTDMRTTEDRAMSDGSVMRLRFTRFNVTPDRFESRMDVSTDRGATWVQGNLQLFVRRTGAREPG